jgi:hypothetical protein
MKSLDSRLAALERATLAQTETAASIIAMLQRQPRNAEEFVIWAHSLSPTESAALMATVNSELEEWRQRREGRG